MSSHTVFTSIVSAFVILGITPVDIWRRVTGNDIVQDTQQSDSRTCIDAYTNFKQLSLWKDDDSHYLYFLNAAYSDPVFTSAEDASDPMVIVQLDISNAFGSLCVRLVLDVLSGKVFRDYACGIKVDEEFETTFYKLRSYFGFFKLAHTCETILRFYSYDDSTNYVKCSTEDCKVIARNNNINYNSPPELMVFCLVTLHLWGRIFEKFLDLRGLAYTDDGNIIGRLSQTLRLISELKSGFKLDDNLDFNPGKTMFLTMVTTESHVYDRAQVFKFFYRTTQAFKTLHKISLRICSPCRVLKYRGSHRHGHILQGLRDSELSQDNKERGQKWSSH